MDPEAAERMFAEALEDGDLEAAEEYADAYAAWVAKGGFIPEGE